MARNDPYKITVWAGHSARAATVVGDVAWALDVTTQGIAADPEFSYTYMGTYQRLARSWAQGLSGHDPHGAAMEVLRLITTSLLDPTQASIATWYALLAELHLSSGMLNDAGLSLDCADRALETYGQRYTEGLLLLTRARLIWARGEDADVVKVAIDKARQLSDSRGAHLFARRAERLLSELALE